MKCSKCGRESDILTSYVNLSTGESSVRCVACQVASIPESLRLEDAERQLAALSELKTQLEELIARFGPDCVADVPPELEAVAFTPQKTLRAVEAFLRNAAQDRENILATMTEEQRLQAALASAVGAEDFEEAARIRKRLDDLTA